jgi:hypothetical protein
MKIHRQLEAEKDSIDALSHEPNTNQFKDSFQKADCIAISQRKSYRDVPTEPPRTHLVFAISRERRPTTDLRSC